MDCRCGSSAHVVFSEATLASIASARPFVRPSRLNMVEVFFGIITRQAIRRGSFDSVGQLATAIRASFEGWNDRCHPFTWTKTADEIMPHATRKRDSDA